jgi:hypothetical protein
VKETESQIVSAICDYLAARRHFFWRQNTTPAIQKSADGWAFKRMPKHSLRGVPDIIVIRQGRFVNLEAKRPGAKQSPDQLEFERRTKLNGAEYYVVHSINDVLQALGL